jgi:hypothetical protein
VCQSNHGTEYISHLKKLCNHPLLLIREESATEKLKTGDDDDDDDDDKVDEFDAERDDVRSALPSDLSATNV